MKLLREGLGLFRVAPIPPYQRIQKNEASFLQELKLYTDFELPLFRDAQRN